MYSLLRQQKRGAGVFQYKPFSHVKVFYGKLNHLILNSGVDFLTGNDKPVLAFINFL